MTLTTPHAVRLTAGVIDQDTAARVALAAAGVAGDVGVAIGIQVFGTASRFLAAVHDGRDAAVPLTAQTRTWIRTFATARSTVTTLQQTAQIGLGLLAPHHAGWPARLAAMRGAAPLVLWVRGDVSVLDLPSVTMAGTSEPRGEVRRVFIDVVTGLCARGWVLVSAASRGVDRLAVRCADAMKCPSVTVEPRGLTGVGRSGQVDVSEVPPGGRASDQSTCRALQMAVGLGAKLITDQTTTNSDGQILEAARAMNRPVGVLSTTEQTPPESTDTRPDVADGLHLVRSPRDAEWFH